MAPVPGHHEGHPAGPAVPDEHGPRRRHPGPQPGEAIRETSPRVHQRCDPGPATAGRPHTDRPLRVQAWSGFRRFLSGSDAGERRTDPGRAARGAPHRDHHGERPRDRRRRHHLLHRLPDPGLRPHHHRRRDRTEPRRGHVDVDRSLQRYCGTGLPELLLRRRPQRSAAGRALLRDRRMQYRDDRRVAARQTGGRGALTGGQAGGQHGLQQAAGGTVPAVFLGVAVVQQLLPGCERAHPLPVPGSVQGIRRPARRIRIA